MMRNDEVRVERSKQNQLIHNDRIKSIKLHCKYC